MTEFGLIPLVLFYIHNWFLAPSGLLKLSLQGWKSEKSVEKYFVVRSIILAKEVLLGVTKFNFFEISA